MASKRLDPAQGPVPFYPLSEKPVLRCPNLTVSSLRGHFVRQSNRSLQNHWFSPDRNGHSQLVPLPASFHVVNTMAGQPRRLRSTSTITVLVLAAVSSLLGLARPGHYQAPPGLVEATGCRTSQFSPSAFRYSLSGSCTQCGVAAWPSRLARLPGVHDLHVS
jgi:hypothetical protein